MNRQFIGLLVIFICALLCINNELNAQNVSSENDNNNSFTIRENGITIDYSMYNEISNNDFNGYMFFEVYIDGTMNYFIIEYVFSENDDSFQYMLRTWNIKSATDITSEGTALWKWDKTSNSFNFNLDVIPTITDDITENLSEYGVDRRNINIITRIIIREINKHN